MRADPSAADDPYLSELGTRIRRLRARRGMSRRILAQSSGVSERYLADLESGKGNISILRLRDIGRAMDIAVEDLIPNPRGDSPEFAFLSDYLRRADARELHRLYTELSARPSGRRRLVALIGLRGAGKSSVGAALAALSGRPFIELVDAIETAAGVRVNEIFSLGGQSMYRRFERQCLDEITQRDTPAIVAVGGSVVSEPSIYEHLLAAAVTVWLRATPDEHMQRVIAQGDHRPMAGNARAMDDLKRILAERESLYRRADATVDTSGRSVDDTAREILALPTVAAILQEDAYS